MSLKRNYDQQRNAAKQRNIDFEFTYDEWISWWGDDIHKRGRTKNDLCMCRINDTGPYHPNNVYKATMSQNNKDQNKWTTAETNMKKGDHARGKSQSPEHTTKKAKAKCKSIQTPDGIFDSRKMAANFYNVHPSNISYYLKKYPSDYYYL